jgi:hypothetical protein
MRSSPFQLNELSVESDPRRLRVDLPLRGDFTVSVCHDVVLLPLLIVVGAAASSKALKNKLSLAVVGDSFGPSLDGIGCTDQSRL